VLPRFIVCVAVIGIPGASPALGYVAIVWVVNASVAVATGLFTTFLHASLLQGVSADQDWFSQLVQTIGNGGRGLIVVIIGFIPLLIMFLYAAFLLVLRTIMIGFCVATAPLCFATAAFDTRNRFLQHWLDMLLGAAMTPIVMGSAIAISFTLASSVVSAFVVGPLLAIVVLFGGVWMSGKLVHQLTWRHFSHGGAIAGFAAGVSTMLGPLHHIGSAGFIAEAMGANRGGTNRAIEAMKRLGEAARGSPPSPRGAALLAGATHVTGASRAGYVQSVLARGGPPPVAQMLDASGRAVVEGVEDVFNQQAFDRFATDHRSLIGSLTRDHPYGALAFADRAKVAWERVSQRSRAAFADEFLSHWLAADTAAPEPAGAAAVA
jgi:hypothetical protein